MNMTPKEKAIELWMLCYPNELDNGNFIKGCWGKKYATFICDEIIKETIDEYSNDENHDRVLYWKEVKEEIKKIGL